MGLCIKLLVIFALGVAELWAATPAGLVFHLHPALIWAVAGAGAISGGVCVILAGERLRIWLIKKRKNKKPAENKKGLVYQIWQRYGVIGWGLLAPVLVGPPLGAALGLTLGAQARRLMLWLTIGSIIWTTIFTLATVYGLKIVSH